jgi:hypothetical protein
MVGKEIAKEPAPTTMVTNDIDDFKGTLRNVGGSRSDVWNTIIADQTVQALWLAPSAKALSRIRSRVGYATIRAGQRCHYDHQDHG